MWFDVLDEERVRSALAAEPNLQDDGDTWSWIVDDSMLGTVKLEGARLQFLTNSKPRSERGRQLIERIAQDAVAYCGQDCVDPREEARKAILSGAWHETPAEREDEIPPETKDQLHQEFMAKHNHHWLDDQIPALDHQTPRFAAQSPTLQPRLVTLLKEIENEYLRALAAGEPAFDPTWMWEELGLSDHQDAPRIRRAVRLTHESMDKHLPGIAQAVRAVAESRCADGAGQVRTAITQDDLHAAAPVQQLIDDYRGPLSPADLLAHAEFYCNWEMHRRKTFWVDESLAWMLANTQVDAEGNLFRLPFPSYVLVYTDRHTLSVAERALAGDKDCPLRGQMLAVLCAYVMQLNSDGSQVRVGLAFDSLAGQPPHLTTWELHVDPDEALEKTVDDALAIAKTPVAAMFRPLLDIVINATLYTTSAGVKIEQYRADQSERAGDNEPGSSDLRDSVYYLPGKIEISQLRKLRQVARGPGGRALMHRFMVRGHWRRPNPNWKNQSLRWIEPYWRGPSLAAIIEREYRLNP